MRHQQRDSEHVRRSLFAMLAVDRLSDSPVAVGLDEGQWALLQRMARQHRLEPLLHDLTRRSGGASQIPSEIRKIWEVAFHASAMRTLAVQATLIRVHGILANAGVAYAALKGARLAWHAYAHPALRPMRDLDILVSPASAREVYERLTDDGFKPSTINMMPIAVALEGSKHLPGLQDPSTGVFVEVHVRLFEHISPTNAGALLANPDALLANLDWLELGQQQIACLPATETLLHLIEHSAYDHRFDNGPQIVHDVAVLIASASIDWHRFWNLAHEGEWERGCQLVLRLTEHFLGPQPVEWGEDAGPEIPGGILDKAALMMLQDTDLRQDIAVQLQLAAPGKASASQPRPLLGRLLPAKHIIAAYAGISPDRPGVWLHYPAWLLTRLARTLRGAVNQRQKAEVARAIAIERWLTSRPGSLPPLSRQP